tara:strand:- start:29441 stop:30628 length:1188 start_codon:yes stop_codon:yes gene_type:complete
MSNNEVKFCVKCVESNQRFLGSVTHEDKKDRAQTRTSFDEKQVCSACLYYEYKKKIDWGKREEELIEILDQYRNDDGSYDVVVPGSGGKDSIFVAHTLKHKYKMNPLTCTWAPHMYTDVGWRNYIQWVDSGYDNFFHKPDGEVHRNLTRLSFKNLLHPFQPFAQGQVYFPLKMALEKKIKLVVYGDSQAERGSGGNLHSFNNKFLSQALYTYKNEEDLYYGGYSLKELKEFNIHRKDLNPYLPLKEKDFQENEIKVLQLPYFINYNPQSNFYFAKEKTNFEVNPDGRSEGTYTKYSSLDDKIDGLHHYTWFIKTGRGRATEDAALEIRNDIITRDEGIALVKKYDGEFPKLYFKEILEYLGMSEKEFTETIDKFRPKHIWKKNGSEWELKNAVWK